MSCVWLRDVLRVMDICHSSIAVYVNVLSLNRMTLHGKVIQLWCRVSSGQSIGMYYYVLERCSHVVWCDVYSLKDVRVRICNTVYSCSIVLSFADRHQLSLQILYDDWMVFMCLYLCLCLCLLVFVLLWYCCWLISHVSRRIRELINAFAEQRDINMQRKFYQAWAFGCDMRIMFFHQSIMSHHMIYMMTCFLLFESVWLLLGCNVRFMYIPMMICVRLVLCVLCVVV